MVRSVFSLMRTTKEINEDDSVRDDCAGKPESKNIKYLVPHRSLAGVVLGNHDRRLFGEGFAVGDRYLSRIKLGHRRSPHQAPRSRTTTCSYRLFGLTLGGVAAQVRHVVKVQHVSVTFTRRTLEAERGVVDEGELWWGEPRLLLGSEGLRGMIHDAGATVGHGQQHRAD